MNGKPRILLAEDDPSVLKMTKVRLEHEGYAVIAATDGQSAYQQALASPVQLILLDIRLPKCDGYEVCRLLRRQQSTARIPIIIFTASETQMEQMAERCIEIGANDWIRKPFRTVELLEKIQRLMNLEEGPNGGKTTHPVG